jgi:hypothetical protein
VPRHDGLGTQSGQPVEDPRPRLRVTVADPRVAVDDEVGGEQYPLLRKPQDCVAERVPASEGERLRPPCRAAEVAVVVELLDGMAELEVRELRLRDLGERRASNSSSGFAFISASRASVRSRMSCDVLRVATTCASKAPAP